MRRHLPSCRSTTRGTGALSTGTLARKCTLLTRAFAEAGALRARRTPSGSVGIVGR